MNHRTERAELPARHPLGWIGLDAGKFHDGKRRNVKVNEHNGKVPRDWGPEDREKRATVDHHDRHPIGGPSAVYLH